MPTVRSPEERHGEAKLPRWRSVARRMLLLGFRRVVTTNSVLFTLALLIVGGSFYLSLATGAWHWFQRSGAVLVAIGAMLSTRSLLRAALDAMLDGKDLWIARSSASLSNEHREADFIACFTGFWVVGAGTLIWAYGDLVGWLSLAAETGS